jgi:AbrB family looped-hinge helix DNA binding protein
MVTTLTIDKAGRLVLPKPIREELQIRPGDSLEVESFDEHILLRPATGRGRMRRKHGVMVFDSGEPLSAEAADKTIKRVRDERASQITGRSR